MRNNHETYYYNTSFDICMNRKRSWMCSTLKLRCSALLLSLFVYDYMYLLILTNEISKYLNLKIGQRPQIFSETFNKICVCIYF